MESVGAVKELCKVTQNLENRIEELETIQKELTDIKANSVYSVDSSKSFAEYNLSKYILLTETADLTVGW